MGYDGNPEMDSVLSTREHKFYELFEDAKRRQERKEKIYSACLDSECTFQPDIGYTKYFSKMNETH
jgi:hypothetical protein